MTSWITAIGTAVPKYRMNQDAICLFMQQTNALDEAESRKLRMLYERSGIHTRHSVVPDYDLQQERKLFPATISLEPLPSLESRMELYYKEALPLALQAIQRTLSAHPTDSITHLITVSCTGMSAPGLDLELMTALNLPFTVQRTSINFMGCYAAVHALKLADAICHRHAHARVLVVSVELCTLHFQKGKDYDTLTANALFADGAAACIVSSDPADSGLELCSFHSEVHASGKQDMAWHLSSKGFLMTLSAYIPQLIGSEFVGLVNRSAVAAGLSLENLSEWAIHPGGRKILEVVSASLQLTPNQLDPSYQVLQEYGNMSSATLLFVLKQFEQTQPTAGYGFAAAFGPGLTMETFIYKRHVSA